MRITLTIFSLVAGGAERVIVALANHWAANGHRVNLLTLESGDEPSFYDLHEAVHHTPLGIASKSKNAVQAFTRNVGRVRRLRRAIRETAPDVVISLMSETNVLTLFATIGMDTPVVVQEQNNPYKQVIGRHWDTLRRWIYPRATRVVVLNRESLSYFPERIRRKSDIIPNFAVVTGEPRSAFSSNGAPKTMIAMGRFVPQKGFDMLLQAFAKVAPKHEEWSLEILGDGPLRSDLESLAVTLGLEMRVNMPGRTREPFDRLRRADLFVMSSRYEGFPLSLCEAMACGLPAVSFDCSTGPGEIIRDGVDGLLVPPCDIDSLSIAMDQLMTDDKMRETLAGKAPEVLGRFGVEKIMNRWDELLAEVAAEKEGNTLRRKQRINVLFLIRSLGAGGAERQLTELVKRLDRSRFDITLVTFYDGGLLRREVEGLNDIRVISLGKRSRWDALRTVSRLMRAVRETKPDIIHGYMGIANELALLLGRVFGARVVWGMRMSQMDKNEGEWLSLVSYRVGAWLSRFTDLMIANSFVGRNDYAKEGYAAGRMVVVSNGIDIDRFRPNEIARNRWRAKMGIGCDEQLVGIVGRLNLQKDHTTFFQAAAALAPSMPKLRLVCVGDGPENYREQLRHLTRRSGLEERMIWIAASSDMPDVYNGLDLLTLTSAYGEGFPNVVGEGMACGIPVVVTAVGDAPFVVGDPAQVVPARDPDALAAAIQRTLALSQEEKSALALALRDRIVREFSMEHLGERTAAMLEDLV